MNFILFDDESWDNLLPLTFTRPVGELRIGILTIKEKWEKRLQTSISYFTQTYLKKKYKTKVSDDNILINGSILPNNELIQKIINLKPDHALVFDNTMIATRLSDYKLQSFSIEKIDDLKYTEIKDDVLRISYPWDIFKNNGIEIESDFELLTKDKISQKVSNTNNILNQKNIFIEEGASVEFATLNANTGKIYIGKDTEVMEGSVIRGPFALCDHSTVKLSAKIYGPTTIGPHSKVGGEINNSVFQGYSNKAHDGFLGNAVIGEWCNLGADTNNSNLKNNYAEVKVWNYPQQKFVKTGLQFCGLIMGDYSKCGINTMFNTGTVVGVNANIFGSGFPRNFIPSFSWGGASGFIDFSLNKAFEVAQKVMERRGIELDETEKEILTHIFETTKTYRKF